MVEWNNSLLIVTKKPASVSASIARIIVLCFAKMRSAMSVAQFMRTPAWRDFLNRGQEVLHVLRSYIGKTVRLRAYTCIFVKVRAIISGPDYAARLYR